MLFFFAPFVWLIVMPLLFIGIFLVRAFFWLRSPSKPNPSKRRDGPFIEGEFIDEEEPDKSER